MAGAIKVFNFTLTPIIPGLIFGVIETITPLIGWAITTFTIQRFAANYITDWDHWIAFKLLLAITTVTTSIDAMAVDFAKFTMAPAVVMLGRVLDLMFGKNCRLISADYDWWVFIL